MFGWKPCACATGSTKISSLGVATYLTPGPVTKYCYVHPARTHAPRARERGLRPHLQSARMYRAHLRPPPHPQCIHLRTSTRHATHSRTAFSHIPPFTHQTDVVRSPHSSTTRRCTRGAALPVRACLSPQRARTWSRRPHTSKTRCRTDMQQHSSAVSFGRSYQQTTATHGLFSHLACRSWRGCAQAPRLRLPAARRCEHSPS